MSKQAFDWGLYAALIRKRRKDLGYKTAKAFSDFICMRTRVKVSEQTLYKIESGKQIPNANVFFALNLASFGTLFPMVQLDMCMCPEWREIDETYLKLASERLESERMRGKVDA